MRWGLNLRMITREANVLPPQHIGSLTVRVGYVVYITDFVWAAVYRNVHCKNSGAGVTPKCPKPWCCCYTMVSHEHYGVA